MTTTVYLNRSLYALDTVTTTSFPQAVLVVTDHVVDPNNPGATLGVGNAFNNIGCQNVNPPNAPAAGDLGPWGLSLATTQGDVYADGNVTAVMYSLGFGTWNPDSPPAPVGAHLANVDSYIEATGPIVITTSGDPNPADQVARPRFTNLGGFGMVSVQKDPNSPDFPNQYNPGWLSADTRDFQIIAGASSPLGQSGVVFNTPMGTSTNWSADDAKNFIAALSTFANANPVAFDALFSKLHDNESPSTVTERPNDPTSGKPVYNIALARVNASNSGAATTNAQIAFRLFTTLNAGLTYDGFGGPNFGAVNPGANPAYPPGWPAATNLIGVAGRVNTNLVCFPCFGDKRVASGTAENLQTDVVNALTFTNATGVNATRKFFGVAHLDINDPTSTPYDNKLIHQLINGAHVCMVAEIIDAKNHTQTGMSPGNSGNLAQRNLAIDYIPNPGPDPRVRAVQHTFEFVPVAHDGKPEKAPPPNELLFLSKKLPPGTTIDLFMPGLPAKKTFHPAPFPLLPGHPLPHPVAVDDHTVHFGLRHAARIPIAVPAGTRYPGLLTVTLPGGADVGQRYDIDVLQLDPASGKVVGAFRISTPVVKARTRVGPAFDDADAAIRRVANAPPGSPWSQVLAKSAHFAQVKARVMATELVKDVGAIARRQVAVVLDRIEVPIARKSPITVDAIVLEGGYRVATHAITIPRGEPGIVPIGQVLFDGPMFDSLVVKLLDHANPAGPVLLHERAWTVLGGRPVDHIEASAGSDPAHPSSWRVWFHVVNKSG